MHNELSNNMKIIVAGNAAGAATTTIDGSVVVDTGGYQRTLWLAILGDITATSVLNLKVQDNTANSTSGMADITGATTGNLTAGASDYDNKVLGVDVKNGKRRYQRFSLARGTANAVVQAVIAICYNGDKIPTGLVGDLKALTQALAA